MPELLATKRLSWLSYRPELIGPAPESAELGAGIPGHQDSAARGQIAVAT